MLCGQYYGFLGEVGKSKVCMCKLSGQIDRDQKWLPNIYLCDFQWRISHQKLLNLVCGEFCKCINKLFNS